jgi:hypothetical protein
MTAAVVLTASVSSWFTWQANQRRREDQAVAALTSLGTSVQRQYVGPAWLAQWLGDDPRFARVTQLWCDDPATPLAKITRHTRGLHHLRRMLVFGGQLFRSDEIIPREASVEALRSQSALAELLVDVSPRAELDLERAEPLRADARKALASALPELAIDWIDVH